MSLMGEITSSALSIFGIERNLGNMAGAAQSKAHVDVLRPFRLVSMMFSRPTRRTPWSMPEAEKSRPFCWCGTKLATRSRRGRLRFHVSGSRHVLTEVQFAGSSVHSLLLAQPKEEHIIARYPDSTIQLAMK